MKNLNKYIKEHPFNFTFLCIFLFVILFCVWCIISFKSYILIFSIILMLPKTIELLREIK